MRTQCTCNLKQIGLGLLNFEGTFKRLPPLFGGVASPDDQASVKFPNVWGSTHVFILPYIEQDNLYKMMASGTPANYVPSFPQGSPPAMNKEVSTYVCPMDPSVVDGIIAGGKLGGTSYAVNAQVFAPLQDEKISGAGQMFSAPIPNYTDRDSSVARIRDGSSNTIGFMHAYALCGSTTKGNAWGYTAGLKQPPSAVKTFQPWSRATYIGQSGMLVPGDRVFQNQPTAYHQPYDGGRGSGCDPLLPATPHQNAMMVLLMDASVRSIVPSMSVDTWNKACLPNDGNEMPTDW